MKKLLLSLLALLALSSGSPRTTTTSSPIPDVGADLQEVWDWLEGLVTDGTSDAAINVNMYMAYNQMSMTGTKFSMDVGSQAGDEDTGDRMATGTDDESTETWSWSWKPSSVGGTINMYMYKNAMSMEDTVFTMNVDDNGNMSGSASASLDSTNPIMERSFAWMRSGLGGQDGKALSVNMFMFNNTMSMKETIFTMDVANDE